LVEMKRSTTVVQAITLCFSVVTALTAALSLSENNVYKPHLKAKIASSVAKGERREQERQLSARSLCAGCQRPPVLCVCEALPSERIITSTHVLILQHPNEYRKKTFSTVPLIPLVLEKCQIRVGYEFEPEKLEIFMETIKKGQKPLLLFPGPDALSLDAPPGSSSSEAHQDSTSTDQTIFLYRGNGSFNTEANESFNTEENGSFNTEGNGSFNTEGNGSFNTKDENQLLILIDGTWAEARRMVNRSPLLLEKCQQVQFTSNSKTSIYDAVRKEPEKHCLSTLEACAEALLLLEPAPDRILLHQQHQQHQQQAKEAKSYLEAALRFMIERKSQVQKMRNPKPRFDTEKSKIAKLYRKNKQRLEKEKELFRQEHTKDSDALE
jgi:DTW domain-containing protein YfiP